VEDLFAFAVAVACRIVGSMDGGIGVLGEVLRRKVWHSCEVKERREVRAGSRRNGRLIGSPRWLGPWFGLSLSLSLSLCLSFSSSRTALPLTTHTAHTNNDALLRVGLIDSLPACPSAPS
jgi:hypothetical protein